VSLLLDALKRAEEAKRQAREAAENDAPAALSPAARATTPQAGTDTPTSLPPLPDRLELLDQEFFGDPTITQSAPQPPAPGIAAKATASAPLAAAAPSPAAARALFDAKQPTQTSNAFLLTVSAGTVLALIGIGGYFWWQLQPRGNGLAAVVATPTAPPPAFPAVVSRPAPPPAAPVTSPTIPPDARPAADPIEVAARTPSPAMRSARRPAGRPQTNAEADSIRFAATRPRVDPALEQGYSLLQAGDRRGAQGAYLAALRNDPNSRDALHGLAAIAAMNQDAESANSYYQKALAIDPKDPVARAGLNSLPRGPLGEGNYSASGNESRLRSALAEQPSSGPLNFALGNALASSNRWPEAQQAYFLAVSADAENPDYLFNLAVSLDQLRKAPLAIQYYQRAINAASRRSHSFDTASAAERIRMLQP
jgi:tetratricopeptide (TPR) repeat protein